MSYINPLHPPVKNQSPYSALGPVPKTPPFVTKARRRLPQQPYIPPKWKATQAGKLHEPITFDYDQWPGQGFGVHVSEISSRGGYSLQHMIADASDPVGGVLCSTGLTKIRLRINWPGIEYLDHIRSIELIFQGVPINRAQLCAAVCGMFTRFMEKAQYEPTQNNEWRIGAVGGGIGMGNVFLLSIHNVVGDIWMANIAIDGV